MKMNHLFLRMRETFPTEESGGVSALFLTGGKL